MNKTMFQTLAAVAIFLSISLRSSAGPDSEDGFQGRIALSHDGNYNDEDDWGAFPVAIAILQYRNGGVGRTTLALRIDGVQQGDEWRAPISIACRPGAT